MRVAYADPPYIGQARRHYSHDPRCAEVDHAALVSSLNADFDAWALSLSSPSLREVLPLCPPDVRVLAWVKPFAAFKKNVPLAYAWEPVVMRGQRTRPVSEPTVRDWLAEPIAMKRGLVGAKPERFCFWLFEAMGLEPFDAFTDVFPGTGGVSTAWEKWCALQRGDMLSLLQVADITPPKGPTGPRPCSICRREDCTTEHACE